VKYTGCATSFPESRSPASRPRFSSRQVPFSEDQVCPMETGTASQAMRGSNYIAS
jgi:hypothetical protein